MTKKYLTEDEELRAFKLGDEEFLHDKLIEMLINKDGKYGPAKHPKYAKRLVDFIVKIVPLKDEPDMTAAIDVNNGIIYVGEGFLTDPDKFYQLNVVIRHELAHALLMHQVRMMHKLGKKWKNFSTSKSLFDLINIIDDFEISNRKYTTEDKAIMRCLWLNGREIHALVTEDHRTDWITMPVEEMYDELVKDIEKINNYLLMADPDFSGYAWNRREPDPENAVDGAITSAIMAYRTKEDESFIWRDINEFFAKSKKFKKMSKHYQDIMKNGFEELKRIFGSDLKATGHIEDESSTTVKALQNAWAKIRLSKLDEEIPFFDDKKCEVYITSPEEKWAACQVYKYLLGNCSDRPTITIEKAEHSPEYVAKYNEIIDNFGKRGVLTDGELADILSNIV